MKKSLPLIILWLILCCACSPRSPYWSSITEVDSYIEERPDSALWVLEQIDASQLINKEEKAKYALLYSMALDKNMIDKTDLSILQPAIDYYNSKGSATDKLRTLYYQGRIYQNQGNNAQAMECFVNALTVGQDAEDMLTKARTFFAQSKIYYSLYEWDNFIEANKNAAEIFEEAGRLNSYLNCQIGIINGYILKNDSANALSYIEECKRHQNSMNISCLTDFFSNHVTYQINHGSTQAIEETLEDYLRSVPPDKIKWLTIANAYINIEKYDEASYALSQYTPHPDPDSQLKYMALVAKTLEKQGQHPEALIAWHQYNRSSDSAIYAVVRQDTKFIEERHQLEIQALTEREAKNRIILITAAIVIVLLLTILWIKSRLKINKMRRVLAEQEIEKYKANYLQIKDERDYLSSLLAHNNEIPQDVKAAIIKRLDLLNKLFMSYITNNTNIDRNLNTEIENILANKNSFMESTKLVFAGSHPNFIKFLEEKGLTEWEIGYCCLYAMGLKGKEIGPFIKLPSHYNLSSGIRVKLGINEHETNLGIYIKKLLKSFE